VIDSGHLDEEPYFCTTGIATAQQVIDSHMKKIKTENPRPES